MKKLFIAVAVAALLSTGCGMTKNLVNPDLNSSKAAASSVEPTLKCTIEPRTWGQASISFLEKTGAALVGSGIVVLINRLTS